jgi:hypothetical protein
MGCAGWDGCAGSADAGSITRTGASPAAFEGALPVGSRSIEEAIIRPLPKPTARITNVVPTPAKKMRAFDDMVVYSRCHPTLESLLMFRLENNRSPAPISFFIFTRPSLAPQKRLQVDYVPDLGQLLPARLEQKCVVWR